MMDKNGHATTFTEKSFDNEQVLWFWLQLLSNSLKSLPNWLQTPRHQK